METEKGDVFLHRLATYIRDNEKALAEAGAPRRRHAQRQSQQLDPLSYLNPLSWLSTAPGVKPVILSTDTHHLFYILMRLEALEYPVGTLDVHIDNPSRPMTYVNLFAQPDKSDTLSLASFRSSLSAVSKLSLGSGWWPRAELPSVDVDLKFIYSSFTKLPALTVHAPTKAAIEELLNDPPGQNAIPLDSFKNLQTLQCIDIDPRTLLGWDRLAESLRGLTIKKSGLEDISDIFIGAVVDDQARREGSASRRRRRQIPSRSGYSTPLPDTVLEEEASEDKPVPPELPLDTPSSPPLKLSSLKWAFLKHLSLADNALTFVPADTLSHLTSLTYLDLSSNLLVSVPPGLSVLYNLLSLNLSDNMIDSVLGIYQNLGSVLYLNLSHNRLESLCGLERLHALERVDLRANLLDESSEVGRLATLPNIIELWIEGNPLVEFEEQYRVACFNYFSAEGKAITLDGTLPGFYERRSLSAPPLETPPTAQAMAHSPPIVAIGSPHQHPSPVFASSSVPQGGLPTPPSSNPYPLLAPQLGGRVSEKKKRKQPRRIVEFGDEGHSAEGSGSGLLRPEDAATDRSRGRTKASKKSTKGPERFEDNSITPTPSTSATFPPPAPATPPAQFVEEPKPFRPRHSRYQSEYHSPTSNSGSGDEGMAIPRFSPRGSNSRSATLAGSRSAMRRARQSASMWEPGREEGEAPGKDGAEEYRRRIEALKQDMGDGWLKVFSQSEIQSPSS